MTGSPIVDALIRSALVPAVGLAVALLLAGAFKERWRTRLQGLCYALAFAVGSYFLIGRLGFPPADVSETFAYAGFALAAFLVILPAPLGPRFMVRALVVLALGTIVLWPLRETIVQPMYYRNLVALFCLGLGVWSILERCSGKVRPTTLVLLPMIAATALSFMLLFSASASFSQLVTVVCALFGAAFVLFAIMRPRMSIPAIVPFLSIFVILFMVAGHFYLGTNPWHMIYLCIPYLLIWIRDWLTFIPSSPWVEEAVLGLLAALPLGYFVYNSFLTAGPLY